MRDTHKYIGNIYKTKNCGDVKVLSCEKYSKAVVVFLQTGNVVTTSMSAVKLGQIRDKSLNSIAGGCSLGDTKSKVNGAYKKSYMLWTNMVSRCYRGNETTKNPTYEKCEISELFKKYENFEKWCSNQIGFGVLDDKGEPFHLDKDILVKGNKIYSEDTCCFVPICINNLFTLRGLKRGEFLIGVSKKGDRFCATINKHGKQMGLGTFDTELEAFWAYKLAKEAYVKEAANQWKDKIDPRVYEALMKYQVEITD